MKKLFIGLIALFAVTSALSQNPKISTTILPKIACSTKDNVAMKEIQKLINRIIVHTRYMIKSQVAFKEAVKGLDENEEYCVMKTVSPLIEKLEAASVASLSLHISVPTLRCPTISEATLTKIQTAVKQIVVHSRRLTANHKAFEDALNKLSDEEEDCVLTAIEPVMKELEDKYEKELGEFDSVEDFIQKVGD